VNTEDFRSRVNAKAGPDLTYGAVAKAVEEFTQRGRLAERDVRDCIVRAGTLAGTAQTFEVSKPRQQQSALRRRSSTTSDQPEAVLDQILAAADTIVRHIRRAAFGTESPPFRSVKHAVKSLRVNAPSDIERWRLRKNSLKELQIAEDALSRASTIDRFVFSHVSERVDTLLGVVVPHADPLGRCARQIDLLTRVTGLAGVAEYVLCGVRPRPLRPRFYIEEDGLRLDEENRIRQVGGWHSTKADDLPWSRFPRVKIELDACLVTDTEFRRIYSAVRQSLGLKNQRPTNHRDRQLLAAVQRLGGLPRDQPNKASFWKAVIALPQVKGMFPSAPAAREAYHRALRRARRASG
jgi:hypothetical protein